VGTKNGKGSKEAESLRKEITAPLCDDYYKKWLS
jgi:hypothetical protein